MIQHLEQRTKGFFFVPLFVRPDIQCRRLAHVFSYIIMIVGGKSCFCRSLWPQRTLYMSALITVSISLSLCVSHSANICLSSYFFSLSAFLTVSFTFSSSLLCTDTGTSFNMSLPSAVTQFECQGWNVSPLINWPCSTFNRVAASACACKLVFRDQGWLIFTSRRRGQSSRFKGWVSLAHIFLIILYNSAPVDLLTTLHSWLYFVQSLWFG